MLFEAIIETAEKRLEDSGNTFDFDDLIQKTSEIYLDSSKDNEANFLDAHRENHQSFIDRNIQRWSAGIDQLELLYITSQEAGHYFQQQYTQIPEFENDALLGVLMRLHSNALRITSEIIHLIKGGYADGALARWRTLFEISVTSLVIHKYGRDCAIDYIKHGYIKTVEGREEYQKTASAMGLEPYTEQEIKEAISLKESLSEGETHWHWARKYTGFSKLEKLREHVGLGAWSHNYKLASRSIHADYYDMRSLLGMEEAEQEVLLVGQSNSGMTLPAHCTAIMLNQITMCFLTAYMREDSELDYSNSLVFVAILKKYSDKVGEAFLECQSNEI